MNFLFYPLRIEIQFLAATSHDLPMIAVHVPLPDVANENGEAKRCQFLGRLSERDGAIRTLSKPACDRFV